MAQPTVPSGTRDFAPQVMVRRNYIFATIREIFERFGFNPLETPSFENLETLTGKYGDEGDQLIFKILNSGDFLKKADPSALEEKNSKKLGFSICEKALRYDLTVPFARFVVMNRNDITFPFRRYQIQPVWRADKPQKGRYREFYQCDVDIIGSDSLLNEVELVQIFDQALSKLGIKDFVIHLNNRKILSGLAEVAGAADRMMEMTIAIDKLDKVGREGVIKELTGRGFSESSLEVMNKFLDLSGNNDSKLNTLSALLSTSEIGLKGIEEIRYILDYVTDLGLENAKIELDVTLARGLNYYTGAIFEVKAGGVQMGSICGGGRYDDLTGIFGLPGVSGVGISFGADRIYDVMNELQLFPEEIEKANKVLFLNFGEAEAKFCMQLLSASRANGIRSEIYPEPAKIKKQMKYANDKGFTKVILAGSSEIANGIVKVKDMVSGIESDVQIAELQSALSKK